MLVISSVLAPSPCLPGTLCEFSNPVQFLPFLLSQLALHRPRQQFLPATQTLHRLPNHLIHNLLRTLPLIDHRRRLAHKEWPRVIHGVIVNVIPQRLKIMFHGYSPLGREFLDLLRAIVLPVLNIRVLPHPQRPSRENNSPHIIVKPRRPHSLLMRFRRPGLLTQHEPCPDPDRASAQHQSRGQTLSIE